MSKFATAIKALIFGSTVAFTALSSAYTPHPDQVVEVPTVGRTIPCELSPYFLPGCVERRPRWDDCPRVVRYEPGVWPHFPCPFPKPSDVIR